MNVVFNFYDYGGCKVRYPQRPGKPTLVETIQIEGSLMAHFGLKFGFSTPGASDVATRELTITTNGVEPPVVQSLAGSAMVSEQVTFNDGDAYSLTLVDIDNHGNRSLASAAFTGVVTDTVPPPQPQLINVTEVVQLD